MTRPLKAVVAGLAAGLVVMAGALPAIAQVQAIQVSFLRPSAGQVVTGTTEIAVQATSEAQGVRTPGMIKEITIRIQPDGVTHDPSCPPLEASAGRCITKNYETGAFGSSQAQSTERLSLMWNTRTATPSNGLYDVVAIARSDVPGVDDSSLAVLENIKVNNAPERPGGLSVSSPVRGQSTLSLSWAKNPEPDITGYQVSRATGDGGFDEVAFTKSTGFSDSGLPFDTPIRYQVVAFRASPVSGGRGISSPPAATSSVTIQAPPPPPSPTPSSSPGALTASPKAGSKLEDLSGKLGTPPSPGSVVQPVSLAAPNPITGPRKDGGFGFSKLLPFGKGAPGSFIDQEFADAVGNAIRNPGKMISQQIQINPLRFIAAAVLLLVTAGHLGRGAVSLFRSAGAGSEASAASPASPA